MSRRLTLLNMGLRAIAKTYLRRVTDPLAARRQFERDAQLLFRTPPGALFLPDRLTPTLSASWVSAGPVRLRPVVLYLHGGAYVAGSARTHRAMLARLSRLAGVRACLPNYRLAPEAPFPAAFEDAEAAYLALIARGYAPRDIVIGGDSAGGGLALALIGALCRAGTPPRAGFVFSPWSDLDLRSPSLRENAASDPILPVERITELRDIYLAGGAPTDVRASPVYAAFPSCPPVQIQASDSEILRDDARRMARHLIREGADVSLQTWPDTPHVWQMFDGWIPEARQALQLTADFLRAVLGEDQATGLVNRSGDS